MKYKEATHARIIKRGELFFVQLYGDSEFNPYDLVVEDQPVSWTNRRAAYNDLLTINPDIKILSEEGANADFFVRVSEQLERAGALLQSICDQNTFKENL